MKPAVMVRGKVNPTGMMMVKKVPLLDTFCAATFLEEKYYSIYLKSYGLISIKSKYYKRRVLYFKKVLIVSKGSTGNMSLVLVLSSHHIRMDRFVFSLF